MWDLREGGWQLASVSGDGKVLFWSVKHRTLACPTQGFRIANSSTTRKQQQQAREDKAAGRRRGGQGQGPGGGLVGGSSLSFPLEGRVKASMVVGSEAGAVLRCEGPGGGRWRGAGGRMAGQGRTYKLVSG